MCGCLAHQALVDCTCDCDHAGDRIRQWRQRAITATRERNEARARVNAVERLATSLEDAAAGRSLLVRFMAPTWRSIARMIREAIA